VEVTPSSLRIGVGAGASAGGVGGSSGGGSGAAAAARRPVVSRRWACPVDAAAGFMVWSGGRGGRLLALRVPKARLGQAWPALFQVGAP
jgi:hypothetical protein